jgi:hypothetical protein
MNAVNSRAGEDLRPNLTDRWIRWTTTASVVLLAGIAAVVSYRHMHTLTLADGESAWTAALIPLSVDGMIIASSMTLLADSRAGSAGEGLPWALLAAGSTASLAANMAVAEPTAYGRVIAAWPSFALIGAYELLMRQIRHAAMAAARRVASPAVSGADAGESTAGGASACPVTEATETSAPRVDTRLRPARPVGVRRGVRRLDDADLLARARHIDAEHRAKHDRPASAETLRIRLRIGAAAARALKNRLRAVSTGDAAPATRTSTG